MAKRPESVLVTVIAETGEALLLCRREPSGFWQSVTGSLEDGEAPLEAAWRELQEETGLNIAHGAMTDTGVSAVFEIAPAWRTRFPPGTTHNLEHRFEFRLPKATPVRFAGAEHRGYAWTTLDEARRRVSSWTNREALEAVEG